MCDLLLEPEKQGMGDGHSRLKVSGSTWAGGRQWKRIKASCRYGTEVMVGETFISADMSVANGQRNGRPSMRGRRH